jgi:hypothetical protein
VTTPSTYKVADDSAVDVDDARAAWVAVARPALERTAGTYHATITYAELAEEVQEGSGIRTRRLLQNWIKDVLGSVATTCHQNGEPLLSSLCVRADGSVGPGYAKSVVEIFGGAAPEDPDMHAAEERLKCYRHFGANLPADGGTAALTPQVAAARKRVVVKKRPSPTETSRPVCPTCHLMLPISGQCDNCS